MISTDWVVISLLGAIVVIDVVLLVIKHPTFSNRLRIYGRMWASFPSAWGVLGGHFGGPDGIDPLMDLWWASIGALLVSCVLVGLLHRVLDRFVDPPNWIILLYVPVGLPAGVFLWPQ